jgi:coproporphyrinogen III oxidase
MDLEKKKQTASEWFAELRDQMCSTFEAIDGNSFSRKKWDHKGSGGGEISIMKGDTFEKVGVNISTVEGVFSEEFRAQIKGASENPRYWASGISVVAHMHSPRIPAFHFNTRYLCTASDWFGGGADCTPALDNQDDENLFHKHMKAACANTRSADYESFKKHCDEYFFLPHRNEARGKGGIFFDHLNTGDWLEDFCFIKKVGMETHQAIKSIVIDRKDEPWSDQEKHIQLIKRGRYVEFNLIWDRGTTFGLKTGGSTEAILMSMPPVAKWE